MKQKFLFFLTIIIFCACKEETKYRMQIILENEFESDIEVTVYPRSEYLNGTTYKISDIGSGFNPTNFVINSASDNGLFISKNVNLQPFNLAESIFDSVKVKLIDNSHTDIFFSSDTVINYSENLFDSTSLWNYQKIESDEPDMFNSNPVVYFNYTFIIKK